MGPWPEPAKVLFPFRIEETMKRIFKCATFGLSLAPFLYSLYGCGPDTSPATEDPKVTQARVNTATEIRGYFDKSGGDYDKLSPEDKTKVNALMGGTEESARKGFGRMGGGGAAAPTGGVPATGPGTAH